MTKFYKEEVSAAENQTAYVHENLGIYDSEDLSVNLRGLTGARKPVSKAVKLKNNKLVTK